MKKIFNLFILIGTFILSSPLVYASDLKVLKSEELISTLKSIQKASKQTKYQGVFVSLSNRNNLITSHITNDYSEGHLKRRIQSYDNVPTEIIRQDKKQFFLHLKKEYVIKTRTRSFDFPGILLKKINGLEQYYDLHYLNEPSRVAAVSCERYDLVPKKKDRYGLRLCVEPKSQLLLKVETLGAQNEVVSQTFFTDIRFDDAVDLDELKPSFDYSQWKQLKHRHKKFDIKTEGWHFKFPEGFQIVASSKRTMGTKGKINQLTLTDGLSSFSLFIQKIKKEENQIYGDHDLIEGPMNIYSKRLGHYWITGLGVVPTATLEAVVGSAKNVLVNKD